MNNPMFPVPHLRSDDGATLRAYAAIHLRVPDSGNAELDAMIRHNAGFVQFEGDTFCRICDRIEEFCATQSVVKELDK